MLTVNVTIATNARAISHNVSTGTDPQTIEVPQTKDLRKESDVTAVATARS